MNVTYDGSAFAGYQFQPGVPTVQGALERALGVATGEAVRVHGAGRTDAGVHALGQVVALALRCRIPLDKLQIAINGILFPSIRVDGVREVERSFHPRFSAIGKHYRYLLRDGERPSPFLARFVWQIPETLDARAMRRGLRRFLGRHDFSAFACRPARYADPVRCIQHAALTRCRGTWALDLVGDGFMHNQVRNMVKALVLIGMKKMQPIEIDELYRNQDRRRIGPPAPPGGLYLMRVMY